MYFNKYLYTCTYTVEKATALSVGFIDTQFTWAGS